MSQQIEVEIVIGGARFQVACQAGEEDFLQAAARLLDAEAAVIVSQMGRISEERMLLMAGLMLGDKGAGLEEELRATQARLAEVEAALAEAQAAPEPQPEPEPAAPELPPEVLEAFAQLAEQAEALAQEVEEKSAAVAG